MAENADEFMDDLIERLSEEGVPLESCHIIIQNIRRKWGGMQPMVVPPGKDMSFAAFFETIVYEIVTNSDLKGIKAKSLVDDLREIWRSCAIYVRHLNSGSGLYEMIHRDYIEWQRQMCQKYKTSLNTVSIATRKHSLSRHQEKTFDLFDGAEGERSI